MVVCLVDAARSPSRMALLGIAPRLGEIATDDVPSVADFDLLGLELGELAGLSSVWPINRPPGLVIW